MSSVIHPLSAAISTLLFIVLLHRNAIMHTKHFHLIYAASCNIQIYIEREIDRERDRERERERDRER